MSIVRWNPFREFDDFFRDYHRALVKQLGDREAMTSSDWMPAVDIVEDDQEYQLKIEVPEIPKEGVKLQVSNGMLTISGERKLEKRDEKQHRMERFYGRFSRSFNLPDDVKPETITSNFRDGMLYVHMPKTTPQHPEVLEIEIKE